MRRSRSQRFLRASSKTAHDCHLAGGFSKETETADPLDTMYINDALRALAHCRGQFSDLENYFGIDPDEASIPESHLWNCLEFTIQMLRDGIVIEEV